MNENDEEFVITIPLRGGKNKVKDLDEEFAKVIELEYAIRYLEYMGISPTQNTIIRLLKTNPLSSCHISAVWNSTNWLADTLHIYPFKPNQGFNEIYNPLSTNKKDYESVKRKIKEKPKADEDVYDLTKIDSSGLIHKASRLLENINIYRKNPIKDQFEESDKEDDGSANKRELNLNLQYWKKHYLYPFTLRTGNTMDEPIEPVDEENFIAKFVIDQ